MGRQPNRRHFLAAVGASTFTLAGCTDAADDIAGSGEEEENGDDDDGLLNGDEEEEEETDATPPAIDHGEVISDFDEDIDEWYALNGDFTADEDAALTGSQTVRIEGTDEAAGIGRSFPDGLDVEGQHVSMALRVDSPRPARVTIRLLAPGQADQLWSVRTVLSPYEGWLRMDAGWTGQRGEPFLDDVQEIQITLEDPNAGDEEDDEQAEEAEEEAADDDEDEDDEAGIEFWVDDLRMTPAADQGYVMLTFDDGVETQHQNAFPMLEERDMQAVAAVVPDSLNREGRLTIDQLREMRDAGWDISSHPEGEAFMELDDLDAIRDDVESAYEYLDNRGFPDGARSHFVPYHNINEEVAEVICEYHELNSYFGGTPNAVPFTDPMHLSRVDMHDLDGFTSMIDIAEEYNQLAIGLAHGVVDEDEIDDNPLADMTIDELEELLDYIEESDVQLVTASDLLDSNDDEL